MPRIEHLAPNDPTVAPHQPTYRPLTETIERHMGGKANPEERLVPVADLQIAPEFRAPEAHVQLMVGDYRAARRYRQEMVTRLPVMERRDGTLWAYDDYATVEAMRRVDPTATIT